MNSNDYVLTCGGCEKVVGVLTVFYYGVPHHTPLDAMMCAECLPKRLADLKREGFDPARITLIESKLARLGEERA